MASSSTDNIQHDPDKDTMTSVGLFLCIKCATVLPPRTWRDQEHIRILCCGNVLCWSCHEHHLNIQHERDARRRAVVQNALRSPHKAQMLLHHYDRFFPPDVCNFCQQAEPDNDVDAFMYLWSHVHEAHGDPAAWAVHELACCHRDGRGTPRSLTLAVTYFLQAVELGEVLACHALGNLFMDINNGVNHAPAEVLDNALAWYQQGAIQGYPPSQTALADLLRQQEQYASAVTWYETAAEHGHDEAQAWLGLAYLHGIGGKKPNLRVATYWNHVSALQGCARGMLQYACNLLEQHEDDHDAKPEALYWARQCQACGADDTCVHAEQLIAHIKAQTVGMCAQCGKTAESTLTKNSGKKKKKAMPLQPFLDCARCRAVQYCGKTCQRAHWKASHQYDCVDPHGKKKKTMVPNEEQSDRH